MAAIQLNFSLRTSSNCKTVHLLGSWDNYQGQLPLSKDSSKSGAWKGTFRFQGSTLTQGSRYWYYYIIDGYHVSHDPAKDHVVEPTTGRKLNTLDIPKGKTPSSSSTSSHSSRDKAKRASRRVSADVPKGRSLSPSEIKSPRPQKPGATKRIVNGDYGYGYDQLAAQLAAANISYPADNDSDSDSDSDSDADSDVPSLSSGSSRSAASSPSSVSYASDASSSCTCERYGITRGGDRVKLDCKGERCGYSDLDECSSASEDEEAYRVRSTRRQGMYLRH